MDLVPPSDRVICRQCEPETLTAFGLELPEVAREKPLRAIVLAVGEGIPHPHGGRIPLGLYRWNDKRLGELAPGDEVILPRYSGGTEITTAEGETVISILASDILAVVA